MLTFLKAHRGGRNANTKFAYKKLTFRRCPGLVALVVAGLAVWVGMSEAVELFTAEGSSALPSA